MLNILKNARSSGRVRLVSGFVFLLTILQFLVYRPLASFNDAESYRALARGLRAGVYTQWGDLPSQPPDTFRSPGYPIFVSLLPLAPGREWVHQVVQLGLILGALWLGGRTLVRLGHRRAVPILICLFGLSPQFPFFAAAVAPEILMAFLMVGWIHETAHRNRPIHGGLLWGAMALVRPTFLLFPLFYIPLIWFRQKRTPAREIRMMAVMVLTLLPYGLWNLNHHGVLSLTPIEGGAPNIHDGFWQQRLPGYTSLRYWNGSFMGNEPISFIPPAERPHFIARYEAEWDQIDRMAPMGPEDLRRKDLMRGRGLFPSYTTDYVLRRSSAITRAVITDILGSPGYYLVTRAYTAVRLWIPAPNVREIESGSLFRSLRGIVPTILCLAIFLGGGVLLGLQAWRTPRIFSGLFPTVALTLYWWGIHVPFSIQARYMLPVHLPVLMLIAIAARSRTSH